MGSPLPASYGRISTTWRVVVRAGQPYSTTILVVFEVVLWKVPESREYYWIPLYKKDLIIDVVDRMLPSSLKKKK